MFQHTCLKPADSLRKQLLLSFGIPSFLTIALVVSLAATFAHIAGKEVQSRADRVLREQVTRSFASSASYVAEQITASMEGMEGAVQLMVEATQDRIVGYPNAGWETDRFVPFLDTDTNTNIYPLQTPQPPLDWNFTPNVNAENMFEHFQFRLDATSSVVAAAAAATKLTTASGVYHFQGSCNPDQDPSDRDFYPGCTPDQNNITTGGIVQPTTTSKWLQEKSGDLATFFKPVVEAQSDILFAGLYFANSGAGSSLWYPGHTILENSYVSEGCDWMKQTNPLTNMPYSTEEEISRCHEKGETVPVREFNALEQDWFRESVENHQEFHWNGPFNLMGDELRAVSLSRSVFDRITGQLIGVVAIDVALEGLNEGLRRSRLYDASSLIAIVRFNDGTMFADTRDLSLEGAPKIYETGCLEMEEFLSFQNAFDFSKTNYTQEEVIGTFENHTITTEDGGILTAFPVPLPPKEFDPTYRPSCMVIHFAPNSVFSAIEDLDDEINQDFLRIALVSSLLGILGMLAVFAIVFVVSRRLTQPLLWIEKVAWNIVKNKGDRTSDKPLLEEDEEMILAMKYSPRTEITDLVAEFRSMVKGFRGAGASQVAHGHLGEIANDLTWRSDFRQLYAYSAKKTKPFRVRVRSTTSGSATSHTDDSVSDPSGLPVPPPPAEIQDEDEDLTMGSVVPAPPKKNLGGNVVRSTAKGHIKAEFDGERGGPIRSYLFWWIFILIVIPLLLTNALICGIVSVKIVGTVPDWVVIVEEASLELEQESLNLSAYLKAFISQARLQEVTRDLHIMTRMASWLFFDGVNRSGVLVDMDEATEDCKMYPVGYSCPFFSSGRSVCSCDWQDVKHRRCTDFNATTNTRDMQRQFWFMQARDADNTTGVRMSADSFPEYDYMPNTTLWWNTTEDLPGAFKGKMASGYETSYDRIRVASSMAVVNIPLYRYGRALRRGKHDVGTFLGFEADGTFMGYDGCDFDHAFMSHWSSREYNNAAKFAPDLCPVGKYGYDSRCREWYASGKEKYMEEASHLYITAPYVFSRDGNLAASATSPIVNRASGEYVGQVLLDFLPLATRDALLRLKEPLAFLITPNYDGTGGDTVVSPNRPLEGWESANILDRLFPGTNVSSPSPYRDSFERGILQHMKKGGSNLTDFSRPLENGEEQILLLAYHPVHALSYEAIRPDDFTRGVDVSEHLVYSVGVATCAQELRRPFRDIEDDVLEYLERLRTMYLSLVALVTFVLTVYICMINVSVTRAMITLLEVVKTINAGKIEDDLPPLRGGSKEVNQIYHALAKLIKIVRMSNVAFFSGNLNWAHDIISDALDLFRTVGDQKAIGVACNNLGNTLHAMAQEAGTLGDMSLDSDTSLLHKYKTAVSLFNEAVEIGQRGFDEASDESAKADFAQQLADRLFNRAMFGLLAYKIGIAPEEARGFAFQDLARVKELDKDVKEFWLERKLLLKNSGRCYSRLLRRIHGLIDFYGDEELYAFWKPKKLIEEADQILIAAWNEPDAGLFEDLTPVGRLQQLEDAAMRLDLLQGKKKAAARLAMRMFAEDEYLLETSFSCATRALVELMRDEASESWNPKTKTYCRQDLRRMLRTCKNRNVSLGKSVIFGVEINERFEGDALLDKVNENCIGIYDTFCSDDDFVGVVAYTVNGDLNVELGMKEDNEGRQRGGLEMATTATSDRVCPALPYAAQMVIDSPCSENDTFIILIADGYSWDPATFKSTRSQIERLNRERHSTIHVIILGLDVEEEEVAENYKSMCTLSKLSMYTEITLDNMDATFRGVGSIISGRTMTAGRSQCLTMEKF